MNMIQLIACVGLITGFFILLRISPMDFTEGVFRRITSKPRSIRAEVNESTRRKKKSFLRREIEDTQNILRMTGRSAKFPMVCALSLLLFLVGAAFALTLGNLFLMPVLAVGIPTMMEADDLLGRPGCVVTPRQLDTVVKKGAELLSLAVNKALQQRLSIAELCYLAN